MLDDLGLAAAIEWQARQFEARYGIACTVQTGGAAPAALPLDISTATSVFFRKC